MQRKIHIGLLLAGTIGCASSPPQVDVPSREWRLVTNWPQLSPGVRLGQVSGVSLDSRGHVLVFHRAGHIFDRSLTQRIPDATVFELDPASGRLIKSWGAGMFIIPHSITVDSRDHVWITDVSRQQVLEFDHDGKLLNTIGEERVAGRDGTHFNEPTDVVVLADGSFYVSDGYQNSRVARFASNGRYLREWGGKGKAAGEFNVPHGLAMDTRGIFYVADRENSRLQQFDSTGKFLRMWPTAARVGRIFDVAVSPKGNIYLASKDGADAVTVLSSELKELSRIPYDSTVAATPHAIAVDGDSVIYLADTGGAKILKFVHR